MPIFQVYLNGKKVSTAGVGDHGVMSTMVTWVCRKGEHTRDGKQGSTEEELRLEVGGLITPKEEYVDWLKRDLQIGDEVSIRIVENAKVDRPKARRRSDPAADLRAQKQYVRRLAKKFGWKIKTR